MDEQAAVEALVNANAQDDNPAEPVAEQATATESPQVEQEAPSTDFVNIDQLPDELKPFGKQLLGDYTRKTQEIAPLRNTLQEYGLSAEEAREALGFVQALQDPHNLKVLYENLSTQFGGAGQPADEYEEEEFTDPRDRAVAELSQKVESFESNMLRQQAESTLDRFDAVVRGENPNWQDEDMNTVYRLAVSHGGDVLKAAEDYKSLQQRILGAHLGSKAQVPVGGNAPGATAHAEAPVKFNSMEEAHKAAMKALAEDLAS